MAGNQGGGLLLLLVVFVLGGGAVYLITQPTQPGAIADAPAQITTEDTTAAASITEAPSTKLSAQTIYAIEERSISGGVNKTNARAVYFGRDQDYGTGSIVGTTGYSKNFNWNEPFQILVDNVTNPHSNSLFHASDQLYAGYTGVLVANSPSEAQNVNVGRVIGSLEKTNVTLKVFDVDGNAFLADDGVITATNDAVTCSADMWCYSDDVTSWTAGGAKVSYDLYLTVGIDDRQFGSDAGPLVLCTQENVGTVVSMAVRSLGAVATERSSVPSRASGDSMLNCWDLNINKVTEDDGQTKIATITAGLLTGQTFQNMTWAIYDQGYYLSSTPTTTAADGSEVLNVKVGIGRDDTSKTDIGAVNPTLTLY